MSPPRLLFALAFAAVLPAAAGAQDRPAVDRDKLQTDLRELEQYFIRDLRKSFWEEPSLNAPKIPDVVQRIKQLRHGEELRREAIALAMRHARIGDRVAEPNLAPSHDIQLYNRLSFAWVVLTELEVLHPGMSLQEAVQILGTPTPQENGELAWHYTWGMRYPVQPALFVTVKDGRIVTLRQGHL
jgi:hypothetical protein